ncbi:TetR/AcrR family transcriptional regulator [Brachybacterium sp. GCM10030267]|uniref:TetR/AcrR family transcriptional regulator n=1 Tax=unclassified Brachybacterium TaxID=2623841 RepID=UPI003616A901
MAGHPAGDRQAEALSTVKPTTTDRAEHPGGSPKRETPLSKLPPADASEPATPPRSPGATDRSRPAGAHHTSRGEEVLDGAAEMFAEHGYHASSLRDIASHVGLSHPGMLHHFGSKEALLNAVLDRLEARAQSALDHLDEYCTDGDALLRALAEVWHPASHPIQLLATLDAEAVSKDLPSRFRVARLHRVHEHVLEQCFAQLDEKCLLRDGIDPPFASRAVLALVLNLAAREETVRAMQSNPHDDAPMNDLAKLVRAFLKPAHGEDPASISTQA